MVFLPEFPDEGLMLAYRDGNVSAFAALYGRHERRVFRHILRMVRDHSESCDLAQEVWIKVTQARRSYEPTAKFSTWLYHIVVNHVRDYFKLARNRNRAVSLDDDSTDEHERAVVEPTIPAHEEPDRWLMRKQSSEELISAIDRLPVPQREALLLHIDAGLSLDEIAATTSTSFETVKSRIRYAMKKLRDELG